LPLEKNTMASRYLNKEQARLLLAEHGLLISKSKFYRLVMEGKGPKPAAVLNTKHGRHVGRELFLEEKLIGEYLPTMLRVVA
jgi:hypothetical protein